MAKKPINFGRERSRAEKLHARRAHEAGEIGPEVEIAGEISSNAEVDGSLDVRGRRDQESTMPEMTIGMVDIAII